MPDRFRGQPMSVPIGTTSVVELPPRSYLGRLVGMLFDHDRTFLLPGSRRAITELVDWCARRPNNELLLVGHTDASGDLSYNVDLSRERALVVAAFLTDDVDAWLARFQDENRPGKLWGVAEEQRMLAAVAGYEGNIDGRSGPRTEAAVGRMQDEHGLARTGQMVASTRRRLVELYVQQEGTSLPAGTRIRTMGCGSHHPLPDITAASWQRRVEILVSEGPIEPAPGAPDGPEYNEWVKRTSEVVEFAESPTEIVELDLEWPVEVIEQLPEDFLLVLTGDGVKRQEKGKSAGIRDTGFVRFEFRWPEKASHVELVASAAGKHVTLWRPQEIGDLQNRIQWSGGIEALFTHAPVTAGGD